MMNDENPINNDLFNALVNGTLHEIHSLHKKDPRVLLGVTFQRDTPLHIAAREGHQDIVDWILQEKPSLAGARNKDGNTPLHEAAKCGNSELVDILLQRKKSSAYYSNKFGETVLIIASKYGHAEAVKVLLKARSYNDASERRQSLRVAAYGRYPDVAQAILNNPIKHKRFRRRLHALHEWDTYEDIIHRSPIKSLFPPSVPEVSDLHAAIHGGDLAIVEAVLNSCARYRELMTKMDEFGRCAIHVAAMKGQWDIITLFVDKMPDCIEIRNSDHKSVLHFAVENDQFEMVRNLLEKKSHQKVAELVSRDHDCFHNTVLHLAAKRVVDPELVEFLVSFPGVDLNTINDEGMTALDIASDNPKCANIAEKLRVAGATRSSLIPKSNTTPSTDPSDDSKKRGNKVNVETHMIVASLIATVTFAAIFQLPGGIADDRNSIQYGAAKMAFRRVFRFFIFSDTAAFTTSLTVVVAWIFPQLLPEKYVGRQALLSHMSAVTLLFSILLTIVAFVSSARIVIVPANYKNLKSTDKEAFCQYKWLDNSEMLIAIFVPLYVGTLLLYSTLEKVFLRLRWQLLIKYMKTLVYIILSGLTIIIILNGLN